MLTPLKKNKLDSLSEAIFCRLASSYKENTITYLIWNKYIQAMMSLIWGTLRRIWC